MARYSFALLAIVYSSGFAQAQHADRAGSPDHTAWYARSSDTGRYTGYYVGGGNACRSGQERRTSDGTWGWDYCGFCLPSRINLDWYHGRRYQGGPGAYRTDGPRFSNHAK
jgi:hypothetical protein